jgi:ketosteroid isomerase-like protein
MNDLTAVRRAVDRLLAGALGPMLDLLAEDAEFEVASGGDVPGCRKDWGRQPVLDYFTALSGLVAFWQMDYTSTGEQVIAWGKESFTVEHCGLEGASEFALVFDLSEGMITRFLVIEDVRSFMRGGGLLVEASAAAGREALLPANLPSASGSMGKAQRGTLPGRVRTTVEEVPRCARDDGAFQTGRNSSARLRTNGSTAPEGRHSRRSRSIAGKSSAGVQTSTIRSSPSTTQ